MTSTGQAVCSRVQSGSGMNASDKCYYTTFPCLLSTPPQLPICDITNDIVTTAQCAHTRIDISIPIHYTCLHVRSQARSVLYVTWYGHSAFALNVGGVQVLVDPFLTGNPFAPISADVVEADYILVTHGHADHVGDTVAIAKRTGALVISNFEICNWLQAQDVPHLAGDTGLFCSMRLIGEEGIDVAALPIGDNFTVGPDEALRAVRLIEPRVAIPIHYDTFDVIVQDPQAWAEQVRAETSTKPVVLKPGEYYEL